MPPKKAHPDLEPCLCACGCGETITPTWNYSTRRYTSCKHGHGMRVQANKRRNLQQEARIIELYRSGFDIRPMSRFTGLPRHIIRKTLKRHNVKMRHMSDIKSIYKCNDHYFDEIDCEEKAYWLGFIAADGTVCTDFGKYMFALELSTKDIEHVRKLKRALHSSHPLLAREQTLDATGKTYGSVRLAIGRKHLVESLISHGIVPRKTYLLEFPDLPRALLRHYCRGFIDGDGSFYRQRDGAIIFSVSGKREFLLRLQRLLMCECQLSKTKFYTPSDSKAVSFSYGGRDQARRILQYLYDDATVYLERKARFFLKPEPSAKRCRFCGGKVYSTDVCHGCSISLSWNPRTLKEELAICKRFKNGTPINVLSRTTRFSWSVVYRMLVRQGILEENTKDFYPYHQLSLPLISIE